MSKTVLMCGGPADGRWVLVEDHTHKWDVAQMPRIDWRPNPAETEIPVPTITTYRIYQEDLFGESLWVGIPMDQAFDDRRLIMRAVLQRDVAQHLGAYR